MRKRCTIAKPTQSVNSECRISEAAERLLECSDAIDRLKESIASLEARKAAMPDLEWTESISAAESQLQQTIDIVTKYSSEDLQENLRQSLLRRREKRLRIRKRKEETRKMRETFAEQRKSKHEKIDRWLSAQDQKIHDAKRRAANEQRVEEILAGVKRRKSEAEKNSKSIELLKKLHRIRRRQKNLDENYEHKVVAELDELSGQWRSFLLIYEKEESDIRKFMQKDSVFEAWNEALFGGGEPVQERRNLKDLIRVRSKWDRFLVSKDALFGSSIPPGWVCPPGTPSPAWQPFTKSSVSS